MSEMTRQAMRDMATRIVSVLARIPDGVYCGFFERGITIQAYTQDDARQCRSYFPGVFWEKKYSTGVDWWEYNGVFEGVPISIYAVREAPPTCRAIAETVEADAYVQVDAEGKELPADPTKRYGWVKKPKVVTKWVCGDGNVVSE